ncbi:MAG: NADP-dependent phosphogluconate dehydrogenase [Solirubrobacteraceae bacterium]
MSGDCRFGLTGLAVMGANLARNVARHDIPIAVHNRTPSKTEQFIDEHGSEGPITGTGSVEEFVGALAQPRVVMTMVKAGAPVDAVVEELAPRLSAGDIIIDGGNSHFRDTQRRAADLERRGLRFLGVGVSGGEEGALNGPSIMAGGDADAYAAVEPILTAIAARVDGTPCCAHIGTDGAGHYVKMVHNGIEYADIQLIAEAFDLLRHGAGLDVGEVAEVFGGWNEGELDSFLIEITAIVLGKVDGATGRALVDVIVDQAEQKGTGRWTAQDALELGVPLTAITEAVFARSLSALRDQRATASERLAGPRPGAGREPDRSLIEDIRHALYASKIVAYAQGFQQIAAAAETEGWDIDLGETATIWRGGCIIRARFLDRIREAYEDDPHTQNLLLVDHFRDPVAEAQDAWRRVVVAATELGVPVPAFSSALAYYDGYRRERGPASLIQGLRDYFGAHTYRRVDRDGVFHTRWGQDGAEVRTDV